MPSITHLYLGKNDLESVDFLKNFPQSLTHLDLHANEIHSFDVGKPANRLKVLNFNENKINKLCGPHDQIYDSDCWGMRLRRLKQLQCLSIVNVGLEYIATDSLENLSELIYLDMSENKISEINNALNNLVQLKTLILENNQLIDIPNISNLKNLEYFSVSNNNLTSLKRYNFDNLLNLKILKLSHNGLTEIIPGTFNKLVSLEVLDLSSNKLQILPNDWITPKIKLKYLFLNDNLLTSFQSSSIIKIKTLQHLNIGNNPLRFMINLQTLWSLPENLTMDVEVEQYFELPSMPNMRNKIWTDEIRTMTMRDFD
ncbi:Similar to lgr4: Leucine-rich repeat-containing G-protein coupled receptor 4 (Danio rerio) [Cotesia congregata]|uniref:Similar to lgr4: Leucine-rich repeat-containing G-protein coupled receptor 4 (Danio rerio) n=1 Tax=Cotesia congregata TaxID=51543 RepID=A0A8J2MSU8_COTCN|nr:Similar to lgr4: Leucine-rich repeat-containing G-protein coupled receptor 4 (Danio rerio) [Cotesia congregata]